MVSEEEEAYKEGGWNQAKFEQIRIHELKQVYLRSMLNPLAPSVLYPDKKGYEVAIRALIELYNLSRQKFSKGEKEEIDKLRERFENELAFATVHENKRILSGHSSREVRQLNKSKWSALRKELNIFNDRVNECRESHGMDNPSDGDDEDEY